MVCMEFIDLVKLLRYTGEKLCSKVQKRDMLNPNTLRNFSKMDMYSVINHLCIMTIDIPFGIWYNIDMKTTQKIMSESEFNAL